MAERLGFQDKQYAFAAHIRDPQHIPAPDGIEDRRMALYRNLFFNNLRSLLSGTFPVLRKLHADEHWDHFIREFMRRHQAKTPYFLQLPEEFLAFLQDEYELRDDDFPFLLELAHYEYIELALSISTASNELGGVDPDGNLLQAPPVRSSLCWDYSYRFPVHRISPDFLPSEPGEQAVFLAVYRRADDKVRFLELNPLTARLLQAIDENPDRKTGDQLLRAIAVEVGYADVDAFVRHGASILEDMRDLEILIGTATGQQSN